MARRLLIGVAVVVAMFMPVYAWVLLNNPADGGTPQQGESTAATVVRVVDGDTIVVQIDGAEETVRLLNIDTPEADLNGVPECLANEATNFTSSMLPPRLRVEMRYDTELRDQYGRLLAGVFVGDTFINAEIARAGLAIAVLVEPNDAFLNDVEVAVAEAQANQYGLWDPDLDCWPASFD